MRALLLTVGVTAFSIWGLFVPFVGMLAYIGFGLLRPDVISYASGGHFYSIALAITLILGSIRKIPSRVVSAWVLNPTIWMFLLLQIPLALSIYVSEHKTESQEVYLAFGKMSLVAILIPIVIETVQELQLLLLTAAVSLGAHGVWQTMGGVLTAGRPITHGIGGFMSDNNTFAAGLCMIVPFCWFLRHVVKHARMRWLLLGLWFCCIFTVFLTYSRGAALSLAAILAMTAWYSNHRAATLAGLSVGIVGLGVFFGQGYVKRIETIGTYQQDESAMIRIIHNRLAIQIALDHPLLGVGIAPENYFSASQLYIATLNTKRVVVHNSFLQILVHTGFFGFFIFTVLFLYSWFATWRSALKWRKRGSELHYYPLMLMMSVSAYIVASLTQPRYVFDFAYQVAMFCAAWFSIDRTLEARYQFQALEAESSTNLPENT